MSQQENLKGLTALITRPLHQAEGLAKLISAWNGKSILFPTIEIVHLNCNKNITGMIIFTSANAVKSFFGTHKKQENKNSYKKIISIGPGTTQALQQYNIYPDFVPEVFNSEGILNLPILQNVKDQPIHIICGENPRFLLKQTILERGGIVTETICYRRQKPEIANLNKILTELKKEFISIIICTSSESLLNLYEILHKEKEWLTSIPLLVISEKMLELARKLSFKLIFMASNPTNNAVLETLLRVKIKEIKINE